MDNRHTLESQIDRTFWSLFRASLSADELGLEDLCHDLMTVQQWLSSLTEALGNTPRTCKPRYLPSLASVAHAGTEGLAA